MSIRVLLVEDNEIYRRGLRAFLDSTDDIHVVGEAGTGDEAKVKAEAARPDVVVLDLKLPDPNGVRQPQVGINAMERVIKDNPDVKVLVVTQVPDDHWARKSLSSGARGYVVKEGDDDEEEILRAVQAVYHGDMLFGPFIAKKAPEWFLSGSADTARPFPQLSAQEFNVLVLLARSRTKKQIASELGIQETTVGNLISNVCTKLEIPRNMDRHNEAVAKAIEAGLREGPLDQWGTFEPK